MIELKYGRGTIALDFDESRFRVLSRDENARPLTDAEIGARFDDPNGSPGIDELVHPGQTVLIVVPDATREVGCGQVINLLVRRLIAGGVNAFDIRTIFATGIHRKTTDTEKAAIVTPFIAQRIKMLDHDPRDLMQIKRFGETSGGIPIELNRALVEHDHVILIGGVSFHYFAGFTGGRKLICPGLASTRTIAGTHKLAFDSGQMDRRVGVGSGRLDGNPVHNAFVEAASAAPPSFAVTTIVNDLGEITDISCGDWVRSHRSACDAFADRHRTEIAERRDLVIASCGGYPHDINMIQAHKALDTASKGCAPGGTIILLAECPDGLGRVDMIDWFDATDSREMASRLVEKYQVNGQTAWSIKRLCEEFNVILVSSLAPNLADKMGMVPADSLPAAMEKAARWSSGYILTNGARTLIEAF